MCVCIGGWQGSFSNALEIHFSRGIILNLSQSYLLHSNSCFHPPPQKKANIQSASDSSKPVLVPIETLKKGVKYVQN